MTVIMPSTPGLGEDVATRKGWARGSPETRVGTEQVWSAVWLPLQQGELGQGRSVHKMAPTGPPKRNIIKGLFVSEITSETEKGNVIHGMHG